MLSKFIYILCFILFYSLIIILFAFYLFIFDSLLSYAFQWTIFIFKNSIHELFWEGFFFWLCRLCATSIVFDKWTWICIHFSRTFPVHFADETHHRDQSVSSEYLLCIWRFSSCHFKPNYWFWPKMGNLIHHLPNVMGGSLNACSYSISQLFVSLDMKHNLDEASGELCAHSFVKMPKLHLNGLVSVSPPHL